MGSIKTVVGTSKVQPMLPQTVRLVNQVNGHHFCLSFLRPYIIEKDKNIKAGRRHVSVLDHTVSIGYLEAVLVVAPKVKFLCPGSGDRGIEMIKKMAKIRLLVDGEEILRECPIDAIGPIINPPTALFYGADDAGRRLGLFLTNGSRVVMHVKGIAARVRTRFDAALYTTRAV
jgi:hypothetical protein